MLHKDSKPEDSIGSCRPLSIILCLGKPLAKTIADNLSNWTESNKKLTNNKIGSEKTRAQVTIYSNFLKQLNLFSIRGTKPQVTFLMSGKPSTKFGIMGFSLR